MRYLIVLFFGLSIILPGVAQTLTEEEKALEKILPVSFDDYKLDGLPMTVTSRSEDKPYSMSSKNYKKGTSTISIVIFDYKENPVLLKKYTSSWTGQNVDDEKRAISETKVDDLIAWQSYDKIEKDAQLYVNVNGRYLLYISGDNHSVDFLKSVAKILKLRQLPK
jgi:hypothetical protein